MNHDVFISYSEPDKAKADAVCSLLERKSIRCWVAPRDILPGMTWGSSIVRAIQQSKVFILVFSSHSNHSPQVVREVERAVRHSVPIIPFKIEEATPTGDMEYFISAQHWLDAVDPPLERHIERLASVVKKLLAEDLRPEGGADDAVVAEAIETTGAKAGTQTKAAPAKPSESADRAADRSASAAGISAAEVSQAQTPPTGVPPRIERSWTPSDIVRDWRLPPHSPAKPFAIAGGIVGGVLLLAILVVVIIALVKDDDNGDDTIITPPVSDSIPSNIGAGFAQTFTLMSGIDGIHPLPVPPGETRTVVVQADGFDAIVEVWRQSQRIDASAFQPEEVVLSSGNWVVSLESYDARAGSFNITVADGLGTMLSNEQQTLVPQGRRSLDLTIPSGETRRVTVSSSEFDVVLFVFEKTDRKDATSAGSPEEVVLGGGEWELIVKSFDTRAGDYTVTVR